MPNYKTIKKRDLKREFFNRKARREYNVTDSLEAGIVLTGNEIKAIRAGRIDMSASYAKVFNEEVFWLGGNINIESGDRQRTRKLLLKKEQIKKLIGKTAEQGLALIPLKLYLTRGKAKLELGIGRGMKKYEKRSKLKERDIERDINISLKETRNKKQ
jgi:SsrA-binding protein